MDIRSVVFAQYFVPLQLVLVLAVGVSCEQLPPLTCSDTASRVLVDKFRKYNCTPPEHSLVECKRTIMYDGKARYTIEARFKVLDEIPDTDVFTTCVGLEKFTQKFVIGHEVFELSYSADFNSSMAVGILTADQHNLETNRTCNISMLRDILQLRMFKLLPNVDSFWDFRSPFYGMKLEWFQGLSTHGDWMYDDLLESLQNTSLQLLNITGEIGGVTVLIKNTPRLKKLILRDTRIRYFHEDSFIGTPQMESLIITGSDLRGIPQTLQRIPQLRTLHIINAPRYFFIGLSNGDLSHFTLLEDLDLSNNDDLQMRELPPLSMLKRLSLRECKIRLITKYDIPYFPQLEKLILSGNSLVDLEKITFTQLETLKLLDLSGNKLRFLNESTFTHLENLELLNLSANSLEHLEESTFKHLENLTLLDLSNNKLTNWPIVFGWSLRLLDLSHNSLTYIHNLGSNQTTVEYLNISSNKINNWTDMNIFYIEKSAKWPNNVWVKNVDFSNNEIVGFSELMSKSTTGLELLDLGGNPFDCKNCHMPILQNFLIESSVNVTNFGTRDPLHCSFPYNYRGYAISDVQFDETPCLKTEQTLLIIAGALFGVVAFIVCVVCAGLFRYRGQITYMLHLYNIKRRAQDFSQTNINKYAFDAFICYSSRDRPFVVGRLAPLLEKGKERYTLCLHERDFPLGSRIVDNIVATIQHSRKTIIVLSEHFVKSKWCNWELGIAHDKMFNEDDHFLILIQLGELDRSKLKLHLKVLMSTRTYLEWPSEDCKNDKQICERLKRALGPSIIDTAHEPPISLSDIIYSDGDK